MTQITSFLETHTGKNARGRSAKPYISVIPSWDVGQPNDGARQLKLFPVPLNDPRDLFATDEHAAKHPEVYGRPVQESVTGGVKSSRPERW